MYLYLPTDNVKHRYLNTAVLHCFHTTLLVNQGHPNKTPSRNDCFRLKKKAVSLQPIYSKS